MASEVDAFEEFFSNAYRQELNDLASGYPKQRSLNADWALLSKYNPELADAFLKNPDANLKFAEEAASRAILAPEGKTVRPHVRFFNLPQTADVSVEYLGAEQLDKLSRVEGVVSWVTDIRPLMKVALWECIHCEQTFKTVNEKGKLRKPAICKCGRRDFRLVEQSSDFINMQRAQMQEPVEKLRGNRPSSQIEVWMEDDLTNQIAPGQKVIVTGILRLRPSKDKRSERGVYEKFLDAQHLHKIEREFEEIVITKEEEKELHEITKRPKLFEDVAQSIAPSIRGHNELKMAIALQLFGGTANKVLPDGEQIRPDIHVLLIGDPGCIIGDERVALGNGAIVKIQELGETHLQEISQPLLTGQGYKRATAERFHIYRSQPVIEVVTESGKSIKGTFNHPLLVVNGMKRDWKRLDEIMPGERVAVSAWIPCTITAPVKTGWKPVEHRFGPRSKAKLPQTLDAETAAFLGYVAGDGWVTRTRVAFDVNSEEQDLIPALTRIARKKFGLEPKVRREQRPGKKPMTVIDLHSVDVAANLQFLREKRVPGIVMRSGNKVAAAFLSWLFEADGCVFSKGRGKRAIQFKSSEIEFLRDAQTLLLRFGVHSRVNGNNLAIRRAGSIRKFAKSIGFQSAKKKARLAELVAACSSLQHERGKELSERVVSAKPAGVADVFDVEVPSAKRFIANGIISHNTAKSTILEYVSHLAPKSVFVSGGAASGVGMTASAEKDKDGEGWILKAGAMVLANGGIAIIDEFDKMQDEDRGSIHEAMEQQKISVAKAGIVTQFSARTAVLAAANPKEGRFDPNTPPAGQFNISPALLSRFDLIFAIKDVIDEKRDRDMAEHILAGHRFASQKEAPPEGHPILPRIVPDTLRKYIAYARRTAHPILTDEAMEKIKEFYVDLRQIGMKENTFPITARQIEGIIRLAEASAKMRLSDRVEVQDAERAINLVKFVLEAVYVDKTTGKLDSDVINIGKPKSRIDKLHSMMRIINDLSTKTDLVSKDDAVRAANEFGIDETTAIRLLSELERQGDLYSPQAGFIRPTSKRDRA